MASTFNNLQLYMGGVFLPKSYVDVPAEPQTFDFLYTNFCPIMHP